MGFGKKVDILPSFFGLNPPGLQYSTDNKFVQRLKELQESAAVEKIPLIPTTPKEMSEMLQLCSYVRFKVPQQVLWPPQQCACLCPVLRWPGPASPQRSLLVLSFHSSSKCHICDVSNTVLGHPGEEMRQKARGRSSQLTRQTISHCRKFSRGNEGSAVLENREAGETLISLCKKTA